jgi:hypothetical protein
MGALDFPSGIAVIGIDLWAERFANLFDKAANRQEFNFLDTNVARFILSSTNFTPC